MHRTARTCFAFRFESVKSKVFFMFCRHHGLTRNGGVRPLETHTHPAQPSRNYIPYAWRNRKRELLFSTPSVFFSVLPSLKLKLLLMRRPFCLEINSLMLRALGWNIRETKIKMSRRETYYKYCYTVNRAWFSETWHKSCKQVSFDIFPYIQLKNTLVIICTTCFKS